MRNETYRAVRFRTTMGLGMMVLTSALAEFGCTNAASSFRAETVTRESPRPPKVLVYDFATSREEVTDNQALFQDLMEDGDGYVTPTPYQRRMGEEVAEALVNELVHGLLKLGIDTERVRKGKRKRSPRNALVIGGAFLDVEEGVRHQHIIVGVSPTGKQLDARVHVHQVSEDGNINLLEFMTHTDGSEMVVDSANVGNDRFVMEQMAIWCARQVLASLSDLFAKKDWMP